MSEAPGWYPDPFFGGRERYWDGGEWTEQCRAADTKEHQASAKPRAPLNPERATPSAVAAKFERRVAGGGLATMARPAATPATADVPAWGERPPPPPRQPATTVADGVPPATTTAWPTDTGWTIGAAAAGTAGAAAASAAEATDAVEAAVPPTGEPPAPPTDDLPAFNEPTDHTEEILSQTVEVPSVVHDWSRLTPDEPTRTEEVLADADVPTETSDALEAPEEPELTEEMLDDAAPPVEHEDTAVAASEEPELTEEMLDEVAAPVAALAVDAPAGPADETDHDPTETVPEPPHAETDDDGGHEPVAPPVRTAPAAEAPRPRKRRRVLIGAVVAVLAIVVIVAAASLVKGKGGGTTSAQQVSGAASATIGERYAQVSIDTNVPKGQDAAAGAVSGFSGSGTYDFATSLGSLTLNGPANNGSEAVVVDGSTIYIEPGTVVAELIPGKSWVSATADDLGSNGTPTGFAVAPTLFVQLVNSPITMLQQLEATGVTAHPMGSLIYQGTPVEEYSVNLSPQAVALGQRGVPASLQGTVTTSPTEDVYVANGVIRAVVLPFDIKNNGTTAMGTLAVGFTSWGDSADIAAPGPDQVATWAQLKQTLTYTSGLQ